jgi:hypothetical protein
MCYNTLSPDNGLGDYHDILIQEGAMRTNRLKFEGILARLGEVSSASPSGARGHKVFLSPEGTRRTVTTLKGQGINARDDLAGHDAQRKIGVITSARLKGKAIHVSGVLWDRDFPMIIDKIEAAEGLGMSYEIADAFVPNMCADVWEVTPKFFTGASVMLREKAAHKNTKFTIIKESL